MKKNTIILYAMILIIVFIFGGCTQVKQIKVVSESEEANTPNLAHYNSSKNDDFTKWNGSWNMGKADGVRSSASLIITNANENQFEFSISATFVSTFINEKGEEVQNPHMGEIEGIAYFASSSEAHYSIENEPEYKMIFRMTKDNQITVEEINVNAGKDFGYSPMAGVNVRYLGEYAK